MPLPFALGWGGREGSLTLNFICTLSVNSSTAKGNATASFTPALSVFSSGCPCTGGGGGGGGESAGGGAGFCVWEGEDGGPAVWVGGGGGGGGGCRHKSYSICRRRGHRSPETGTAKKIDREYGKAKKMEQGSLCLGAYFLY